MEPSNGPATASAMSTGVPPRAASAVASAYRAGSTRCMPAPNPGAIAQAVTQFLDSLESLDSPALAQAMADAFDKTVPRAAYEVVLAPDGRGLQWIERSAAGEKRYDTEPDTSWLRRTGVGVLSVLPIDWLL